MRASQDQVHLEKLYTSRQWLMVLSLRMWVTCGPVCTCFCPRLFGRAFVMRPYSMSMPMHHDCPCTVRDLPTREATVLLSKEMHLVARCPLAAYPMGDLNPSSEKWSARCVWPNAETAPHRSDARIDRCFAQCFKHGCCRRSNARRRKMKVCTCFCRCSLTAVLVGM